MSKSSLKQDIATRTLQELDLSENEAVLYSQMLNHPESTVQALITRAPFPRTMLYYVLRQLQQRGLVSAKKLGWRTVYVAEDPEKLHDLLAKKEREFERERGAVRELIPRLKQRYRLAGRRPNVRMFEGVEEYRKALEDVLVSKPKEVLAYESLGTRRSGLEVREAFEKCRIARKLQKRVVFFEGKDALRALATRAYDDFTRFRSLAEGTMLPFDADLTLYEGKLLYTSHYHEHEPTAVLVEDAGLFEMQKSLFESSWKQGKDRTLAPFKRA